MSDTAVQIEMRRRIRRHMLTSVAGVVTGILVGGVGTAATAAVAGSPPPSWAGPAMAVVGIVGLLMIPGIGWWSTFRNLRCPQCNGLVIWQVSTKYSAFSAMASNECRHCGTTIFAPSSSRRFLVLLAVIAVLFMLMGAMMSGFMSARRAHEHDAQPPASSAP